MLSTSRQWGSVAFTAQVEARGAMAARAGIPVQCEGVARSGRRCAITSDSKLRDGDGRLAAAPLQFGGRYCGFHASVFCSRHVHPEGHLLSCFLDFETTGSSLSGLSQLSSRGLAVNEALTLCRTRLSKSASSQKTVLALQRWSDLLAYRASVATACTASLQPNYKPAQISQHRS